LMIVTYDEHGGFFDHVPPPPIPTVAGGHRFDTAGIRVPAFLISPHVKPGTVVSDILDHTSILQLLAERFDGGNDYSPAVAARNAKLGRIAKALDNAEPHADWAPQLLAPPPLIVASGPIRSGLGGSAGASANAEAFDAAAMKAARDHPILISQPGWAKLAEYVGQTVFIA
ncbi:MAG TPA: alkaline phosphatase family protein, partial [Candidatus Cybelea sp.]|nr:alkaline phosphatase family protein [Candidatus Cybelea sp.]